MQLPGELKNKIVDFLISIPGMADKNARQALMARASLDTRCEALYSFDTPLAQFFQLLAPELVKYGTLEDGRDALEAVLEATKNYAGQDKEKYCDMLILELRALERPSTNQRVLPEHTSFHREECLNDNRGQEEQNVKKSYAVFLSYNTENQEDCEAVEKIAVHLSDNAELRPWFDRWELIPGESWIQSVERGLAESLTCAVFVGKSGEAPWQKREVETALRQQTQSPNFRVILVLLADVPKQPDLPKFLYGNTWVKFQKGFADNNALWLLECGIRGVSPGRGRSQSSAQKQVLSNPTSESIPQPQFTPKDLRIPGGALDTDSRFYIMRQVDKEIFEAVHRPRSVITIRGPRQIGKTSLMIHMYAAINRVESHLQIAIVDLQAFPEKTLQTLNAIWCAIAVRIARQLRIKWNKAVWDLDVEYDENILEFLENFVFDKNEAPLLICLDEVDRVFRSPIKSEFFGAIRAFYNDGAMIHSLWRNVRWVLITSSEPEFFIDDIDQSPFNIGLKTKLRPFKPEEVFMLARRHGLALNEYEVDRIIDYVGGRPYLVHLLFYHLVRNPDSHDQLFDIQSAGGGVFRDHLNHYLKQFQQEPELGDLMKKIIHGQDHEELKMVERLESAGLVCRDENQKFVPLCQLYAEFFRKKLE